MGVGLLKSQMTTAQRTMFGSNKNFVAPVPFRAPDIVTGSLTLYLDAANPSNYPGAGSRWTDYQIIKLM